MESWYIPQHLDTPPRILMFTIPEGLVMLICFFAGTATSYTLLTVPFGFGIVLMMRRFAEIMDRFSGFQAYMYWFVSYRPAQWFQPSYIRFWKG